MSWVLVSTENCGLLDLEVDEVDALGEGDEDVEAGADDAVELAEALDDRGGVGADGVEGFEDGDEKDDGEKDQEDEQGSIRCIHMCVRTLEARIHEIEREVGKERRAARCPHQNRDMAPVLWRCVRIYDWRMATYFSGEALKFLRGLKRNNDREWFDARKDVYERELKEPMLKLIGEVNEKMAEFAPMHVRPPQKIMMRIYRDIRFSKNKQPYKTHMSAWWVRDGLQKTSGAGFYFSVSPEEVVIAAGAYMPEREQLLAIRRYLAEHHAEFRAVMKGKKLRSLMTRTMGLADAGSEGVSGGSSGD